MILNFVRPLKAFSLLLLLNLVSGCLFVETPLNPVCSNPLPEVSRAIEYKWSSETDGYREVGPSVISLDRSKGSCFYEIDPMGEDGGTTTWVAFGSHNNGFYDVHSPMGKSPDGSQGYVLNIAFFDVENDQVLGWELHKECVRSDRTSCGDSILSFVLGQINAGSLGIRRRNDEHSGNGEEYFVGTWDQATASREIVRVIRIHNLQPNIRFVFQ